ncbi:Fic family protein [Desulfomicrobium sp. ZS1]|uniref:Fic family protein n=1 Tax=Desulfomicrobium sp. ZS1 TaxID=2952228 RepID=UPI0035306B76
MCPRPTDLPTLMDGLFAAHRIMLDGGLLSVIHAAVVSYGFVFIHPFEDGNGRIHRFLIHNIFFQRGLVPKGLMFPVSAAMLKNPELYEQSLEAFSTPLLRLIDYDLDETGHMTVTSDAGALYRYIDMTAQAEALYEFVMLTIEHELVEELNFLNNYDSTKQSIQNIIDMPDRLIDLFIHCCLQNNGHLSARKRASLFDFLTDDELNLLEQAFRAGFARTEVSSQNI